MHELFRRHGKKITAFVMVAIPLTLLVTSAGASVGQSTTAPMRWVGGALGSMQMATTSVVRPLTGWIGALRGESRETAALVEELEQLREENSRLVGVLQENQRLRELVGMQTRYPEFELVAARVISRDLTPYFRVVKIRIQADDLAPRMPVVSAQGLVGQVHRVYEGYADVVLVSDPRSRVDAISQRSRALGMVEGLGHETDYRAKISYLTQRDEVRPGDVMVTSGMGGVFPRELLIGEIVEVRSHSSGLLQEVVLQPSVDFARLEEVFVITNVEAL
jgi:rod shape-determining protein MreC